MLNIPSDVFSELSNTIDVVEKIGMQVDWINKVIREITVKQEHYTMVRELNLLEISWRR